MKKYVNINKEQIIKRKYIHMKNQTNSDFIINNIAGWTYIKCRVDVINLDFTNIHNKKINKIKLKVDDKDVYCKMTAK